MSKLPKSGTLNPCFLEGGEAREMVIWFDARTAPYIRERVWNPTQQIEEHEDGALTLRFVARGLSEVKRWVLFYGKGAIAFLKPKLKRWCWSVVKGDRIFHIPYAKVEGNGNIEG
jgi:hypothetical protein